MELIAAGFNAHNQLKIAGNEEQPRDFRLFTKVAGGMDIKLLFTGWSCTIYTSDSTLHTLGYMGTTYPPLTTSQTIAFPQTTILTVTEITSIHGSHNGPLSLLTTNGSLYKFTNQSGLLTLQLLGDTDSPKISKIASTNTTQTSITFLQSPGSNLIHLLTFPSYDAFLSFYSDPSTTIPGSYSHAMIPGRVKSLVAGATSFSMLTEEGEVYTWGDPRYSRCLARLPTAEHPADEPALVEALGGIPVSKIDASGWVFGALSKEQDLYLWGSEKPGSAGEDGLKDLLGYGDEEVALVEIEGVESIKDFGIGDGFIVVLAESGDVWVKGDNRNGQLGIGKGINVVKDWTMCGVIGVIGVKVGDLCIFLSISGQGFEK